MKSAYRAPTARRDEARNWLFTQDVIDAYKTDIAHLGLGEKGDKFTFINGPYGGGRKFEVVRVLILDDGLTVVAKEL